MQGVRGRVPTTVILLTGSAKRLGSSRRIGIDDVIESRHGCYHFGFLSTYESRSAGWQGNEGFL